MYLENMGRPLCNPRCPECHERMRRSRVEYYWVCHGCNTMITETDAEKLCRKEGLKNAI